MVLVPPSMTRQTTGMLQWVPFSEGEVGLAKIVHQPHQGTRGLRWWWRGINKIRLKLKTGKKQKVERDKSKTVYLKI